MIFLKISDIIYISNEERRIFMSASPFFYIELFNYKSGNWEKIDLYKVDSKRITRNVCDIR